MALRFIDSFGGLSAGTKAFGTNDDPLLVYNQWSEDFQVTEIEDVTEGRRCYIDAPGTQDNYNLRPKFNTAFSETTVIIGMRFWWEPSSENQNLCTFDNGSANIGTWAVTGSGIMYYTYDSQGRPNTLDSNNATKPLRPNAWNYVELKVFFNDSTGTVDFWLNDKAVGSYTNVDTQQGSSPCTIVKIGYDIFSVVPHQGSRYADIYIDDSTRRGPMVVYYQPCDAAGSAAGFTPLASTNQSQVDEYGMDGDTSYNESTAAVTLDQLGHNDSLSDDPLAIQPLVMARYVPTGSSNIQVGILSGATHDQDAEVGLSDSYDGYPGKIYETDPNTASAWTAANANSAETSYEHSS